jgi:hypothetical protein
MADETGPLTHIQLRWHACEREDHTIDLVVEDGGLPYPLRRTIPPDEWALQLAGATPTPERSTHILRVYAIAMVKEAYPHLLPDGRIANRRIPSKTMTPAQLRDVLDRAKKETAP